MNHIDDLFKIVMACVGPAILFEWAYNKKKKKEKKVHLCATDSSNNTPLTLN